MNNSNKLGLILRVVFYAIVVLLLGISIIQYVRHDLINLGMNLGMSLLIFSIAAILIFAVYQIIDNPKKSIISLLGLAGIVVLFLIAYYSSSTDTFEKTTEAKSQLVGGSLGVLYILGIISVFSIVISEVWSFFK